MHGWIQQQDAFRGMNERKRMDLQRLPLYSCTCDCADTHSPPMTCVKRTYVSLRTLRIPELSVPRWLRYEKESTWALAMHAPLVTRVKYKASVPLTTHQISVQSSSRFRDAEKRCTLGWPFSQLSIGYTGSGAHSSRRQKFKQRGKPKPCQSIIPYRFQDTYKKEY